MGCGCRGQALGQRLVAEGWAVRGTTRSEGRGEEIETAGIEPAVADPERPGTLLDLVSDVAVVHWLLGTAQADADAIAAVHGPRLERLLERLVDTPVRGFVYEAGGTIPRSILEGGAEIVRAAQRTWRIPARIVDEDPADHETWLDAMARATTAVLTSNE
ncbi:MAG: hypothetical protein AABM29_08390 [Actinomycetota bacterium]